MLIWLDDDEGQVKFRQVLKLTCTFCACHNDHCTE